DAFTGRTGVPVTLDVGAECSPPVNVKTVLYRVAQEALNNVAKHAHATEVSISLRGASSPGDCCELVVSDNGTGFDPSQVSGEHLGLGIMSERAGAVGAQVSVESQPGAGTRVRVRWGEK
ncbi:MAG: sensor histidine kinase, partial [Rudaea sp.]